MSVTFAPFGAISHTVAAANWLTNQIRTTISGFDESVMVLKRLCSCDHEGEITADAGVINNGDVEERKSIE